MLGMKMELNNLLKYMENTTVIYNIIIQNFRIDLNLIVIITFTLYK